MQNNQTQEQPIPALQFPNWATALQGGEALLPLLMAFMHCGFVCVFVFLATVNQSMEGGAV